MRNTTFAMHMPKILFFLLFILFIRSTFAQPDKDILQQFIANPNLKQAPVSIAVKDCNTGLSLMSSGADISITPASVLKLVTTATALEVLGNDFRFQTKVIYQGQLSGKRLSGRLLIEAGGDPTLGSKYFNSKRNFLTQWAAQIKQAGIDTIIGSIEVDQSIYADHDVPRTWIWEDLGNYFGAAAKPLALYDNTFELVFRTAPNSGGPCNIIDTVPKIPGLILQNEVVASNDTRDLAYVFGSPANSYRIIRGTLPKNRSAFSIRASIPDPAALLVQELQKVLEENGIILLPETISTGNIQNKILLFVHESPSLAEIIKVLNHESMNLYAEHLCKHLGLVMNGEGSTEAGVKAMVNYWRNRGIDTEFFFMADGSGLSRANAISAATLTDILLEMKKSRHFDVFQASIPLTGLEGTQQFYFNDSFLKGKAHAKSGSMSRVRSFAGYMTTRNGTQLAFAIIINNYSGSSSTAAQKLETLMENIYQQF